MMIRFRIRLDDQGTREIRCERDDWTIAARNVSRPAATSWTDEPPGAAPWDSVAELQRLASVKLWEDAAFPLAPRIAAYLFDVLIGPDDWHLMTAHADVLATDGCGDIELALEFVPAATSPAAAVFRSRMHSVPWELLSAARPTEKRLIAVTRLVSAGTRAPAALSWPPRVLFVLGCTLADVELRPATEAMGLLSALQSRNPEEPLTKAFRFAPPSRILEEATFTKLKEAVRAFRPEVVHFICHGRPGEIVLHPDPQRDNRTSVNAADLHDCLSVDERLPAIVILATCQSGVMDGAGAGSLAEHLTSRGVPVVVGMGGRISSEACRILTRALAESLFQDASRTLVEAMGLARTAAHRLGQAIPRPPEWALPKVYLSDSVPETYRAFNEQEFQRQKRWEQRVRGLSLHSTTLLCCRETLAERYRRALEGDRISVVLATAKQRDLGKSRALMEVGAWALRDGHVPVRVYATGRDWDAPTKARAFGLELINALDNTRKALGLDEPIFGELFNLLAPAIPGDGALPANPGMRFARLCREIRKLQTEQPDPIEVRTAFGLDAENLRMRIAHAHPQDFSLERSRIVVLFDDGHKYGSMLREILLPQGGPATFGLSATGRTFPVFVALDWNENVKMELDPLPSQKWVDKVELKPFPMDASGDPIYELMFLHPYDEQISTKPLCYNVSTPFDVVQKFRELLRLVVGGIPGHLLSDRPAGMRAAVIIGVGQGTLIEAEDPGDLLRQFAKEHAAP